MDKKILKLTEELIDELETLYGKVEGVEILTSHPIIEGESQGYAKINSFTVYYLHKEDLLNPKK